MRDDWIDYPLALLLSAATTTVGQLLILWGSLCLGTWLGYLVLDMYVMDHGMFLFAPFILISIACIQFWGFVYVAILFWVIYSTVYDDRSVLIAAVTLTGLQLTAFMGVNIFMSGPAFLIRDFNSLRLLAAYGGLSGILYVALRIRSKHRIALETESNKRLLQSRFAGRRG